MSAPTPPPEPREPAAREAVGNDIYRSLINEIGGLRAELATSQSDYQRVFAEGIRWHDRAEAAEASLVQARLNLLKYGQHESGCASRVWCDEHVQFEDSKLPCDCGWASTSAPEGTV